MLELNTNISIDISKQNVKESISLTAKYTWWSDGALLEALLDTHGSKQKPIG